MLIRDSIIYFLARYIGGLVSLLTISTFSYILSISDYGIYSLVISLSSSFSAIVFSWIGVSYARLYNKKAETFIKKATFKLSSKLSILSILLLFIFSIITNLVSEKTISFIIFINIATLTVLLGYHTILLQIANSKFDKTTYTKLNLSRLILSLIFGASFSILGIEWCLFGISIGAMLSVLLFSRDTRYIFKESTADESTEYEARILQFGLPLIASIVATALLDNADKFIIAEHLGLESLAYYAAAYSVAQQITGMILSTFYIASYPYIINALNSKNIHNVKRISWFLFISLVSSSILIYIIFLFFSKEIANVIFPKNIALEASKIMPWVSLYIAISCFKNYFLDIPLLIKKKTKLYTYIIILISILNIIGNLVLIPEFGLFGAVYASILASGTGLIITAAISTHLIQRNLSNEE